MRNWLSRSRAARIAPILGLWLLGCDGGSSRSPGSSALTPPPQPESVPEIVLVLPRVRTPLNELWERMAQYEAGAARAIFRAVRPGPTDPPGHQAALIRTAADRAASAVIVVPEDPEAVAPVLAEVRDRGVVPILLSTTAPVPGDPPTVVTLEPPAEAATAMVAAVQEDARAAGLSAAGPAVLVINAAADPQLTTPRAEAFRAALQEAGVTLKPDVHVLASINVSERLKEVMEGQEPPTLIFATDDQALSGAVLYRSELDPEAQRGLLIAGFADTPEFLDPTGHGLLNAGADTNVQGPAREAVRLALAASRGEAIPDRVTIPAEIRRAQGPPRGLNYPTLLRRYRGDPAQSKAGTSD